jgi:hypothetical protein
MPSLTAWDASEKAAVILMGEGRPPSEYALIAQAFRDRPDFWRRRRAVIVEADIRAALDAHHSLVLPPPSPATARVLAAVRADLGLADEVDESEED